MRRVGIAYDVALVHASMSCALESTRLAQRSIMARYVLKPLTFDAGATTYSVAAGTTICTRLLSEFDISQIDDRVPSPEPARIGGVARVSQPCLVSYRQK